MTLVYRNGIPRLQRSVRRGDRVTTEYLGSGESALLLARLERIDRDAQEEGNRAEAEEQDEIEALDRALDELATRARDAAHAELERAGYRRHNRGEWRRSRDK